MKDIKPTEKKFETHIENILIRLIISRFIMKNLIAICV